MVDLSQQSRLSRVLVDFSNVKGMLNWGCIFSVRCETILSVNQNICVKILLKCVGLQQRAPSTSPISSECQCCLFIVRHSRHFFAYNNEPMMIQNCQLGTMEDVAVAEVQQPSRCSAPILCINTIVQKPSRLSPSDISTNRSIRLSGGPNVGSCSRYSVSCAASSLLPCVTCGFSSRPSR